MNHPSKKLYQIHSHCYWCVQYMGVCVCVQPHVFLVSFYDRFWCHYAAYSAQYEICCAEQVGLIYLCLLSSVIKVKCYQFLLALLQNEINLFSKLDTLMVHLLLQGYYKPNCYEHNYVQTFSCWYRFFFYFKHNQQTG